MEGELLARADLAHAVLVVIDHDGATPGVNYPHLLGAVLEVERRLTTERSYFNRDFRSAGRRRDPAAPGTPEG